MIRIVRIGMYLSAFVLVCIWKYWQVLWMYDMYCMYLYILTSIGMYRKNDMFSLYCTYSYVFVCTCIYWSVLTCIGFMVCLGMYGMYWWLVCICMYFYVMIPLIRIVRIGRYSIWSVYVCIGMYLYILNCICTHWYVRCIACIACICTYWLVLVCMGKWCACIVRCGVYRFICWYWLVSFHNTCQILAQYIKIHTTNMPILGQKPVC